MKRIITTFYLMTGLFLLCAGNLHANLYSPIGSYEKLHRVKVLPPDKKYQTKDGEHLDLGIKYSVYHLFGLPVWQHEKPKLVGYLDKQTYLPLSEEIIQALAHNSQIENLAGLQQLPFWDKYGGKIVLISLISGILYLLFYRKREKLTPFSSQPETTPEYYS